MEVRKSTAHTFLRRTQPLEQAKREQFNYTNQWKALLRRFAAEVPRSMHMRQLRRYPETFTGKEAIDCVYAILPSIFPSNKCTMLASKIVLTKYLDGYHHFIENVREPENKQFADNATLFKLREERIREYLGDMATPESIQKPVRRAASVRNNRSPIEFGANPQAGASVPRKALSRASANLDSADFEQLHGRLSVSCNDISGGSNSKNSPPMTEIKATSTRSNLSCMARSTISKASSIFSLNRSASSTESRKKSSAVVPSSSHPKFLDVRILKENIPVVKEVGRNAKDSAASKNAPSSVFRVRTNSLMNTSIIDNEGSSNTSSAHHQPPPTSSSSRFCPSRVLFKARCKLYRYDRETKQNKERGLGIIKILLNAETSKTRCVMRRENVLNICANFPIVADLHLHKREQMPTVYTWACKDFAEDSVNGTDETFSARFRDVNIANEFFEKMSEAIKSGQ